MKKWKGVRRITRSGRTAVPGLDGDTAGGVDSSGVPTGPCGFKLGGLVDAIEQLGIDQVAPDTADPTDFAALVLQWLDQPMKDSGTDHRLMIKLIRRVLAFSESKKADGARSTTNQASLIFRDKSASIYECQSGVRLIRSKHATIVQHHGTAKEYCVCLDTSGWYLSAADDTSCSKHPSRKDAEAEAIDQVLRSADEI